MACEVRSYRRLARSTSRLRAFLASLTDEELWDLEWNTVSGGPPVNKRTCSPWWTLAREEQLPPQRREPYSFWLILAGRGFGKTRSGAEWVRGKVHELPGLPGAFVGKDPGEVRDVMIEGVAGILKVCPPWDLPDYEPSKKRITWRNGSVASVFSTEEFDELRGPQHAWVWWDEPAKCRNADDTWDQILFGLRVGDNPQVCLTTTPRPIKVVKDLLKDPLCVATHGETYDNLANLSAAYHSIIRKYEGTRLGRQELRAEVLEDTPGALWTYSLIDRARLAQVPPHVQLTRCVVGVDPSATEEGNEAGIVGAARGTDDHGYVLADKTLQGRPEVWAAAAVDLFHLIKADHIIAEQNNGGQMVEATIKAYDRTVPVRLVTASRGKITRAEPIALLYERGLVHHVGSYSELEDECCTYEPVQMQTRRFSPNRMDALVWAMTDLFERGAADMKQAFFGSVQMASAKGASLEE